MLLLLGSVSRVVLGSADAISLSTRPADHGTRRANPDASAEKRGPKCLPALHSADGQVIQADSDDDQQYKRLTEESDLVSGVSFSCTA